MRFASAALTLTLCLAISVAAEARNNKVPYSLDDPEARGIRYDIDRHYAKKCPPGLAKKNPPCIPPGQAKRYVVGHRLTVPYDNVPRYILDDLPRAGYGNRYVMVDRDILLISEATKKVLDAVIIASAL